MLFWHELISHLYLYFLPCNSVFYHPYSDSGMAFLLVLANRIWQKWLCLQVLSLSHRRLCRFSMTSYALGLACTYVSPLPWEHAILGCWKGMSHIEIRQREEKEGDPASHAPETELPTWFTADQKFIIESNQHKKHVICWP